MRVLLIILDSVGIGHAPDAARYDDEGADTLGHLLDRMPWLQSAMPTCWSWGLGNILHDHPAADSDAAWGQMCPRSAGKDSTTGHWEIAGVVLERPFGLFDHFPGALLSAIESETGVHFIGNFAASGTQIIEELGPEHLRSGQPILYTSADSVLQIAAHEGVIPLERLYEICRIARRHADAYRIGRVIARPFVGEPGHFTRTQGRHDLSMHPPPTLLDRLSEAGVPVISIGKIADLFDHAGVRRSIPTADNRDGMQRISEIWPATSEGLVFANLVDFDTLYGHRRDPLGYASALAEFDMWLGSFLPQCHGDDLLIITADHGNDPTFRGTDHTREQVLLLVREAGLRGDLGVRNGFADVAATIGERFGVEAPGGGKTLRSANY